MDKPVLNPLLFVQYSLGKEIEKFSDYRFAFLIHCPATFEFVKNRKSVESIPGLTGEALLTENKYVINQTHGTALYTGHT